MFRTVFMAILFTLIIIVILLFAVKNGQVVAVDLVFLRVPDVPLWVVMVGSFLVGTSLTSLIFALVYLASHLSRRGTEKELSRLRAELDAMKDRLREEASDPVLPEPTAVPVPAPHEGDTHN